VHQLGAVVVLVVAENSFVRQVTSRVLPAIQICRVAVVVITY
jgi:hypothetical protein